MEPAEFQSEQSVRTALASAQAAKAWRTLESADDWPRIANRVAGIVTLAQRESADAAVTFASALIGPGVGTLDTNMLAGVATDVDNLVYLPLDSYLGGAAAHVYSRYGAGLTDAQTMQLGESHLRMLVQTQVADAARAALGTAIASTPKAYWYRVIQPPCCQRCAVLRGEMFAWDSAFSRHPRCDCMQGPALQGDGRSIVSNVDATNITDLSRAQRQAIADGADINQVINAQRGVKVVRAKGEMVKLTTEGTTKRGYYAHVRKEIAALRGESLAWTTTNSGRRGAVKNYTVSRLKPRLTPEAIYRFAGSREEAVRMLAQNGYLVGNIKDIARLAA